MAAAPTVTPVGWNAGGLQSCVRWLGRPAPPAASRPTAPDRCPSTYGSGGGSAPGPACSNPWLPGRASPAEFASLGRPGVDATEVRDARAHSTRHARRQGRRARDDRRPWRDSSGDRATRAISAWRWSPLTWCCSPGRANHILMISGTSCRARMYRSTVHRTPKSARRCWSICDTSSRAQNASALGTPARRRRSARLRGRGPSHRRRAVTPSRWHR
jgi:hypothetical protein